MKRIFILLFVVMSKMLLAQATLTDVNLVFDIQEATYVSPFVLKGIVQHSTTEYNGTDIQIGDLVYFLDGPTCYSIPITTITTQTYSYVEVEVADVSASIPYVPTGRAAVVRTTTPDRLAVPPDGIPQDLVNCIENDLRLRIQNGVTNAEEITDYTGISGVAPAVPAASYTGATWRNSVGELYKSDGVVWTPVGKNYTEGYGINIITGGIIEVDTSLIATQYDLSKITGVDTISNYTSLRAYVRSSPVVFVQDFLNGTDTIYGGVFRLIPNTHPDFGEDNNGTVITGGGKTWKREHQPSTVSADWFDISDDADRINHAIRVAGDGGETRLTASKSYLLLDPIFIDSLQNITLDGQFAELKRAPQSSLQTTISGAYSGGLTITVSSIPASWEIGDAILLATGSSNDSISATSKITNIVGNTITMQFEIFSQYGGVFSAPSGTRVFENFNLLHGRPSATEGVAGPQGANRNTIIKRVIFDGNKSNNTFLKGWTTNPSLTLHGVGSVIENCVFRNHPAECANGFGLTLNKCHFYDNGGSAFHLSGHDVTLSETVTNNFTNNTVERVNQVSRSINGHNEGAISLSWNGGNINIIGNYFKNGLTGIVGTVTGLGANGREDIILSGNRCYNFSQIVYGIDGSSRPVIISDNMFYDCGTNNYTPYDTVNWIVCGNILKGNTIINVPQQMRCDPNVLPAGTNGQVVVHNGTEWEAVSQTALENDNVNYWNKVANDLNYSAGEVLIGATAASQGSNLALAVDGFSLKYLPANTDTTGVLSILNGPFGGTPMETVGTANTPGTIWIQNGYNATYDRSGGTMFFRPLRTNGSRQNIVFLGGTSSTIKSLEIKGATGAVGGDNWIGTGSRLAWFNSAGELLRSTYDPTTFLTGNGTANQVTYYTGISALGSSSNFTFNGTNVGIGGIASPDQRLEILGAANFRFSSVDPNTADQWLFIGTPNAILSNRPGGMIGILPGYNATLDKSGGEVVIQGRSDNSGSPFNSGITFVTGGTSSTSASKRMTIENDGDIQFYGLNGTGNRFSYLDNNGVLKRSTVDPATLVLGNGTANQVTYYTASQTITSSSNFVFDGTKVGIGSSPVALEALLNVKGSIQTQLVSTTPSVNGWLQLASYSEVPTQATLNAGAGTGGSHIYPLGGFSSVINRPLRTLVIQGATDGLGEGISLVTGTAGAERMNIGITGLVRINTYVNTLNSSGNPVNVLSTSSNGTIESHPISEVISASGGVTGSGTTNYIPKFTASSSLGNSNIYDNGGLIGIGTTTPDRTVTIDGGSNSHLKVTGYNNVGILLYNANSAPNAAWSTYSATGTPSTPTALSNGKYIGRFNFYGHDGSTYASASSIEFLVDGTVTTGNVPTRMQISHKSAGGTLLYPIDIRAANGEIVLGRTPFVTSPSAMVHVVGRSTSNNDYTFKADSYALPSNTQFGITGDGNVTLSAGVPSARLHVQGSTSTSGAYGLIVTNSVGSTSVASLVVRNDGKIGIGTNNPIQTLHVVGTMRLTATTGTPVSLIGVNADGDVGTATSAALQASGGVTTGGGTTNYIPKFNGSNYLVNSAIYEDAGQVGIGVASPTTKMDINGGLRIRLATATPILPGGLDASGNFGNLTLGTGLSVTPLGRLDVTTFYTGDGSIPGTGRNITHSGNAGISQIATGAGVTTNGHVFNSVYGKAKTTNYYFINSAYDEDFNLKYNDRVAATAFTQETGSGMDHLFIVGGAYTFKLDNDGYALLPNLTANPTTTEGSIFYRSDTDKFVGNWGGTHRNFINELDLSGSLITSTVDYTLSTNPNGYFSIATATSGAIVVTLDNSMLTGRTYWIKAMGNATNDVTLTTTGSLYINNNLSTATTYILGDGELVRVVKVATDTYFVDAQ